MGKLFSLGAGGMVDISVSTGDEKNNLQPGRVLQLNGYNCPRYVIVKNQGVDPKWAHYGTRYLCVNLEDHAFKTEDAFGMKHVSDKKDNSIQLYITDETIGDIETAAIWEKAEAKDKERLRLGEIAEAKRKEDVKTGRALFAKHIPADAVALVVADLETDACDLQTDYFNTTHSGLVVLGWSKHKRDIFSEMRKHAHKIPETEHLATPSTVNRNEEERTEDNKQWWKPSDEHREKYSMGAGYYLKAAERYSTGWRVYKLTRYGDDWGEDVYLSLAARCIFEGQAKPEPPTPTDTDQPTPTDTSTPIDADQPGGVSFGEYKSHPTITLPTGRKGFTFGLTKARAILAHIEEIKTFAASA